MTQSAKAQEPSMEEILASIRRIIADDDTAKPAAPAAAEPPALHAVPAAELVRAAAVEPARAESPEPPPSAVREPADVLELTEEMAAPLPGPGFRTIDGQSDVVFDDAAPPKAEPLRSAPAAAPQQPEVRAAAPVDDRLLSAATTSAVDSAFSALAHTVMIQNGRTLEDLVRDLLRPMLKTWLDDNLPSLVERLVRAEIERVSRGR